MCRRSVTDNGRSLVDVVSVCATSQAGRLHVPGRSETLRPVLDQCARWCMRAFFVIESICQVAYRRGAYEGAN